MIHSERKSVSANDAAVGAVRPAAGLRRPYGRLLKRLLDVSLALPMVIFVLPLLCTIVKLGQLLQSRGPLFYRQKRSGRGGEEFMIFKFRTMDVPDPGQSDIEENSGSRIYPLGTIFRRSKIDEIPQFINVLTGTMSVVGPRPHHYEDCEAFNEQVSDYAMRSVAKPGITGLAQYSEYRGDFKWNCVESRVSKDLAYIQNWSLLLDVQLIFKTVLIVSQRIVAGALRRAGLRSYVTASASVLTIYSPKVVDSETASADSATTESAAPTDRQAA